MCMDSMLTSNLIKESWLSFESNIRSESWFERHRLDLYFQLDAVYYCMFCLDLFCFVLFTFDSKRKVIEHLMKMFVNFFSTANLLIYILFFYHIDWLSFLACLHQSRLLWFLQLQQEAIQLLQFSTPHLVAFLVSSWLLFFCLQLYVKTTKSIYYWCNSSFVYLSWPTSLTMI